MSESQMYSTFRLFCVKFESVPPLKAPGARRYRVVLLPGYLTIGCVVNNESRLVKLSCASCTEEVINAINHHAVKPVSGTDSVLQQ